MRPTVILLAATLTLATQTYAQQCKLKPKEVVTKFMNEFYVEKRVREAFETWVEPGYIQHNPLAQNGRDAAIAFLEPFFKSHPDISYSIKRIIADGNLVAVHWDVAQPVPEKSANTNGMF
jgi:predicted SnoaL-like aldol condensation-catalyzing enzyme